jgi:hypothetical protein
MPLNINDTQRVTGTDGTPGTAGTQGNSGQRDGGNATAGAAGSPSSLSLTGITFQGDPGGDRIVHEWSADGGRGGSGGGLGGSGANAEPTLSSISGPSSFTQNAVYDSPGDGGAGGRGGAGGAAAVRFGSLTVDFAGGLAAQNSLRLWGQARGGYGGSAGNGGSPGNSNWTGTSENSTSTSPPNFSSIYSQQGTAGGVAPNGAAGGAGSRGTVSFTDIQVSGENGSIGLFGTAAGGAGGSGSNGVRGGSGSVGQPGSRGGNGGNASTALAEVARLRLNVTRGLNLSIQLTATGQSGGRGGDGGEAGFGRVINSTRINGVGSSLDTITYAEAGEGGNGGNGGNATARLVDSTISGTEQADFLTLGLSASGGLGGAGGRGGNAVASQSSTTGNPDFFQTSTTVGTLAGLKGSDGITGLATVEVSGNNIALGDSDDFLSLTLLASGRSRVTVSGNSFDGGLGRDTLVLGNGRAGERAATIDVANRTLRLGSTPVLNTLTGFEVFTATGAADRIIDGGGNQEYRGGDGSDRYTFSAGFAGIDVIRDFSAADRIVFSGFGSPLDSFADVFNATTQTSGGALITTIGSSSILLAGFAKASLTSAMFSF